jgi:integrase
MSDLVTTPKGDLVEDRERYLALAGQAANTVAARRAFDDYRSRKANHTLRRQDADLALFTEYLGQVGIEAGDLATRPESWRGITWGIVEGFVRWQLKRGYAVGSINVRLATVKVYARLASKAGSIDPGETVLIGAVKGYGHKESRRIDARREVSRVGLKKAQPVGLTRSEAATLKRRPNTPQGRRDALLMCLLLDHGLRCGEVAGLKTQDFDLAAGMMTFYRPKVDKIQTHRLSEDTLRAARAYLGDAPETGSLWRRSRKDGQLHQPGLSVQAITARVRELGQSISIEGLSAHDCRHHWATQAARSGTDPFTLQEAGGWSSLAMPRRYVESARVANQNVKL